MDMLILITLSFGITYMLMPYMIKMISVSLVRENYRHQEIPVGVGLVFFLVAVPILVLHGHLLFAITILAFGFLGLIDDTIGNRDARGFAGHFRALIQERQLTTGALKALYGGIIALVISGFTTNSFVWLIINGLVIALSANIFNLLDVRPGRTGKAFLLIGALLLVLGGLNQILLVMLGVVAAYLPWDLRAEVMMGDVGSNTLGASLGLLVINTSPVAVLIWLSILVVLHLYGEKHSLSQVIEKNNILRWLDQFGRSP